MSLSGMFFVLEVGDSRSATRAVRELSKIREDKPFEARAASAGSPTSREHGQVVDVTV